MMTTTRYSLGFWLNIRSRLVPRRLAAMVLAMVLALAGNARAFVAIQPTSDTAQIAQALQSPGVRIENIRLVKGREGQLGLFDNTASRGEIPNIALGSGLVVSTGLVNTLASPYKIRYGRKLTLQDATADADLLRIMGRATEVLYDPVTLTFDLIPESTETFFDIVFASDDYDDYVGTRAVDSFGLLLSGPGIAGDFSQQAVNMATLPNGDPISANFINRGQWGVVAQWREQVAEGNYSFTNSEYYVSNPSRQHVSANGWTRVVSRRLPVQPGQRYRVKLVLADKWNPYFDSSVFIGRLRSFRQLSGRLFEHNWGRVDESNPADGNSRVRYFSKARVLLFDSNGRFIRQTYTDDQGRYAFKAVSGEAYRIAVDSASLGSASTRPEQSWSGRGGLCAGQAEQPLAQASYCFGGRQGSVTDELSGNRLDQAQHVIAVPASNADQSALDFGFSYNLVTQTRDSGQGSLRQFIINANAGAGDGAMVFVPAMEENAPRGWQIRLNQALPPLKRKGITLDGRAFDRQQPYRRARVAQVAKSGFTAGALQTTLNSFLAPDLSLMAPAGWSGPLLAMKGTNQSITNMALMAADNRSQLTAINAGKTCTRCLIKDNVIGSSPAGAVNLEQTLYIGIETDSNSQMQIDHNLISATRQAAINFRGSGMVRENLLLGNATGNPSSDAISLESPNPVVNRVVELSNNHINGASGMALDGWRVPKVEKLLVTNNTFSGAGRKYQQGQGEGGGIRLQIKDVTGQAVRVEKNLLANNNGPGVIVSSQDSQYYVAQGNRISQNWFRNNRRNGVDMPIDLSRQTSASGDGLNGNSGDYDNSWPNQGIDAPLLESATIQDGMLVVEGYAMDRVQLQFYRQKGSDLTFSFARAEGSRQDKATVKGRYIDPVSQRSLLQSRFRFELPLASTTLAPGDGLAAIAIDRLGNTSEFSRMVISRQPSQLDVQLWHDLNRDNLAQPGEPRLANVLIRLSRMDSVTGHLALIRELNTDDQGLARFTGLTGGDYQVGIVSGPALTNLSPASSADYSFTVTLPAGHRSIAPFPLVDSRPLFSLENKNQRTSAPGLFVNLPHRVFSTVSGQLTLEARWKAVDGNPAVNWPVSLYQTQCQNPDGASDPLVSPLTLQAEQTRCLQARVFIPADAPQGQAATLEIRAQFIPLEGGAGSVITSVLDRLTVIEEAGRLTLNKWVENLSRSAGRSTANQAQPGDLLRYTIAYTNVGTAPIKALYISDTVPTFTRLSEAVTCPVNQPEGLGRCLVQLPASSNNQPGYNGQLLWQFSGQLQPGDGGELSYQVRLE